MNDSRSPWTSSRGPVRCTRCISADNQGCGTYLYANRGPAQIHGRHSGQSFIARQREQDPLIKHFYVPASVLVSPAYVAKPTDNGWVVYDDEHYHTRHPELSDEDFARHLSDPDLRKTAAEKD